MKQKNTRSHCGLHPASVVSPVASWVGDRVDIGGRSSFSLSRESSSIIVDVETVRTTAVLATVACAHHVAVGSRSGGTSCFNGGAAPALSRVFCTSKDVTSAITGRSALLDRVTGNCDLVGKCPTAVIVAGGEE